MLHYFRRNFNRFSTSSSSSNNNNASIYLCWAKSVRSIYLQCLPLLFLCFSPHLVLNISTANTFACLPATITTTTTTTTLLKTNNISDNDRKAITIIHLAKLKAKPCSSLNQSASFYSFDSRADLLFIFLFARPKITNQNRNIQTSNWIGLPLKQIKHLKRVSNDCGVGWGGAKVPWGLVAGIVGYNHHYFCNKSCVTILQIC